MTLDYRNGVSIAEIVVYVPALAIAIFLAIRHGLGRNAGWLFLMVFCIARIIGPCMQLATVSDPTNTSLYTGSAILQNIGLSPLMLAAIGLLSRLLESIHKTKRTKMHAHMFHLIHLVIIVGLILGIVGGVDASDDYISSGYKTYQPGVLNKAGTALFIVSYVAVVVCTIVLSFHTAAAEPGEKRLLIAVAASLPFILVRLIYSIFATFTHNKNFNLLQGSPTVLLCVALLEEFIVVFIFEGTGLTLKTLPKEQDYEVSQQTSSRDSTVPIQEREQGTAGVPQKKKENVVLKIAKMTIIGHLITAVMPKKNNDVEMQDARK